MRSECNYISHATHRVIQGWEFNLIKNIRTGIYRTEGNPLRLNTIEDRFQPIEQRLWMKTEQKSDCGAQQKSKNLPLSVIVPSLSSMTVLVENPMGKVLENGKEKKEISLSWFCRQRKVARKMFNKLKNRRSFRSFDSRLHHICEHLFQWRNFLLFIYFSNFLFKLLLSLRKVFFVLSGISPWNKLIELKSINIL